MPPSSPPRRRPPQDFPARPHARAKRRRRSGLVVVLMVLAIGLLVVFWRRNVGVARLQRLKELNMAAHPATGVERGVVMAKTPGDDVAWLVDLEPAWTPYIYSASSPPEPGYLPLPAQRGREAMAYLTFIIDHYDALPLVTAFVHSGAHQWHNDVLGPYTASILDNLRLSGVTRLGYANLRCSHEPGCPVGVNPLDPTDIDVRNKDIRAYFAEVYMELFGVGREAVPREIGNVCCGQFAVSRERVRERPREDYVRMRRWVLEEEVTDSVGVGWVFEKVWHVVFGMEAVHCPPFPQCRCDLFGWCDSIPEEYVGLVKGAHPWLGSKLGNTFGNAYAVGAEDE